MAAILLDGKRVRRELDRLRLTQAQFAHQFHLREAVVSRAVRGHPLSAEVIYSIARGLEIARGRS